jgi:hypothetical protein
MFSGTYVADFSSFFLFFSLSLLLFSSGDCQHAIVYFGPRIPPKFGQTARHGDTEYSKTLKTVCRDFVKRSKIIKMMIKKIVVFPLLSIYLAGSDDGLREEETLNCTMNHCSVSVFFLST